MPLCIFFYCSDSKQNVVEEQCKLFKKNPIHLNTFPFYFTHVRVILTLIVIWCYGPISFYILHYTE